MDRSAKFALATIPWGALFMFFQGSSTDQSFWMIAFFIFGLNAGILGSWYVYFPKSPGSQNALVISFLQSAATFAVTYLLTGNSFAFWKIWDQTSV
ncbi:MAG: hypothetical protein ACK51S_08580 [Alphaproteobacteria bacterium]|jgi:heme A synthase